MANPIAGKHAFDTLDIGRITFLRIIHRQDTATLLHNGDYWITSKGGFPADSSRIHPFLKSLLSLEKNHEIRLPRDPEKLSAMELGRAEAKRVEWRNESGRAQKVILGGIVDRPPAPMDTSDWRLAHDTSHAHEHQADPHQDSSYWMLAGQRRVYRTPGYLAGLPAKEGEWRDRNLFPFFLYEDISSVEVTWMDSAQKVRHYELRRTSDTSVVLAKPYSAPVPRKAAAQIFVQAPQFAVDAFVLADSAKAKLAMLETKVEIVISMKNGQRHRIKAGDAGEEFQYASHPAYGIPVKIFKWRFDYFKKTPEQLSGPHAQIKGGVQSPGR